MPKIKMLKTQKGASNGISIIEYEKDKTYTISDDLARVFVKNKWGVEIPIEVKKVETIEDIKKETDKYLNNIKFKAVTEAPMNKAIDTTPNIKKESKSVLKRVKFQKNKKRK